MPRTRPPKSLTARIELRDDHGRITETVVVSELICREMEATGRSAMLCAEVFGLWRESVSRWLKEGEELAEKDAKGHYLNPSELVLVNFHHATRAAHARWVSSRIATHRQMADGGLTVAEVVREVDMTKKADGTPVGEGEANPEPFVVKQRTKTTRLAPSASAIEWELSRLAKEEFAERVEVTGPEGGPVQTEDSTAARVASLLGEIEAFEQGVADGREREAEISKNGSS